MTRRDPPLPPPALAPSAGDMAVVLKRRYRLITPLFGGGVAPAEADPVTLIRAAGLRGHLRFWWRACRGGRYSGNLADMRAAEGQLWGAAGTPKEPRPSRVEIAVEVTKPGQAFAPSLVDAKAARSRFTT